MRKEYLIIGSNNFWYASLSSKKYIKNEIASIKKNPEDYGNPDQLNSCVVDLPEKLHIYKAIEIDQVDLNEEDENEN